MVCCVSSFSTLQAEYFLKNCNYFRERYGQRAFGGWRTVFPFAFQLYYGQCDLIYLINLVCLCVFDSRFHRDVLNERLFLFFELLFFNLLKQLVSYKHCYPTECKRCLLWPRMDHGQNSNACIKAGLFPLATVPPEVIFL